MMADKSHLGFRFATRGVISALDPILIPDQGLARMTNGRLHRQLPRTRYKFREITIVGNFPLIDEWRTLNCQGATFYNPAKGQGAIQFGLDQSQIVEASGGRKFSLAITGRGANTKARLTEQTASIVHNPYCHLVWFCQAENYILSCDGQSLLWRWDGNATATASTGINTADKEKSQLPNACTVLLYSHYRVAAVTDARKIFVGDGLHKSNASSAANLLNATEAVYYNTGQWFSPPSAMGNILAAGILPTRNTQHGQAEAVFHCEDGVFSLQINLRREDWPTQAISRHALLKTGAVGPYAIDMMDGDQVFRSRHGIQTLRSAAAETNVILNPFAPLNGEISDMFVSDLPELLRFTSLVNAPSYRRLFCTIYPVVARRHRSSRGFVSLNLSPTDINPDGTRAWEGIWTLPPQWGNVIQFINGIFTGVERTFALCWNAEEQRKTLIEITNAEGDDELEDGTHVRISSQLRTKAMANGLDKIFDVKSVADGTLFLKDCRGQVDWGVWYRGDNEGAWTLWRKGTACVTVAAADLSGYGGKDFALGLGAIPRPQKTHRYIQLMVRWRGVATVEALDIQFSKAEPSDGLGARPCPTTVNGSLVASDYSDFEYTDSTRWEESNV